jgi:hypothetical protein
MRDLQLPNRIKAKAVPVELVAGWETRGRDGGGYPAFAPIGALLHHTAGGPNGTIPSLATLIYGRPDVEGPLSQVGQSREANHIDKAYVICSGKANHGGVGSWTGPLGTMNSNYESEGLEVEHVGTGSVHPARLETAARIIAAMLEVQGSRAVAAMACTHYEYALPAGRKVDFFNLDPPFNQPTKAAEFRSRVAYWIGRKTTRPVDPNDPFAPAVPPASSEDDDVPWFKRVTLSGSAVLRVVTGEGAVAGFPNGTEAGEYIKELKDAGYREEKALAFNERDEWDRYFTHLTDSDQAIVTKLDAIDKQLDTIMARLPPAPAPSG